MKLAIIVPAYNAACHLPEVIGRIVTTRPPGLHRTVVVDDGSTDDTLDVARALAATNACESRGYGEARGPAPDPRRALDPIAACP